MAPKPPYKPGKKNLLPPRRKAVIVRPAGIGSRRRHAFGPRMRGAK